MKENLKSNIKNRIGERRIMKCGEECEIVKYDNCMSVVVKFIKSGELINCTYGNFKIGNIKSRFIPSVFGIGITGSEIIRDENGKLSKSYQTWQDMLRRCYDEKLQSRRPTYKNCKVCDEWLYYPNFKKWFDENYYEIGSGNMHLDKDTLRKGNKIYSPENCVFVPQFINTLFIKKNANRGSLPIGVSWHKQNQKYRSQCNIFDIEIDKSVNKHLGLYNTFEEAFTKYKQFKEQNIKQVADHYKEQIPKKLYDAMYRYEVEIDD